MNNAHSPDAPESTRPVADALAGLRATGLVPGIGPALEASANTLGAALRDSVLAEVPAFSLSANPDILPELADHAGAHVREILRLFAGGAVGEFDFVRSHARHRAEQHFPLEASLHAYRCGHRVISRWLRETALGLTPDNADKAVSAIADFSIEYTNAISTICAAEYVAHARLLAEAASDLRSELLGILLTGYDESDGRVARLLKRAGYLDQRQSYCVVVVQSANPAEMENPARAQRIITALTEAIAGTTIRMLCGIRNAAVTAILSDRRRQSGWTAPQAEFSSRIHPLLLALGPAVRTGVSTDHPSTSFLPKALREATFALDFASVTERVVRFADIPVRTLLVRHGADEIRSAPPAFAKSFADADAEAGGALVATLRAVADADMNVQKAARALGKHPNTVYARIERIRALTDRDGLRYHDLTELLLAADCWRG